LVEAHGGEYNGDLTKAVTHLLTFRPEGPKYTHAKNWRLSLVSIEWFYESIERGMILDEKLYHPELPVHERGQGAWTKSKSPQSPLGKRIRSQEVIVPDEGKRKIRRTASTKLNSQTGNIWGEIVSGVPEAKATSNGPWDTNRDHQSASSNEIAPVTIAETFPVRPLMHQSYSTVLDTGALFSGCKLFLHGFSAKQDAVLQKFLLPNGAQIVSTLEVLADATSDHLIFVAPHDLPASNIPKIPSSNPPIQMATEFWIEICLEKKSLVNLDSYPLGRPFPSFPIGDFKGLKVCSTGFSNMELLHISKAAALIGSTYEEIFTNESSVLICNPLRRIRLEKLSSAQKWNVPIVSTDWLIHSIETGSRQPFKSYIQRFKNGEGSSYNVSEINSKKVFQPPDCGFESSSRPTKPSYLGSKKHGRPAALPGIDGSAFEEVATLLVKTEEASPKRSSSSSTGHAEPLLERSCNSPHKPSLSPPKTATHTAKIPQEAMQVALNSLLAKSKDAISHHDREDDVASVEGRIKARPKSRILGRAVSNASVGGSDGYSRASSVDSTATTGQAVVWPTKSGKQRDPSCTTSETNDDSQPSTQKLQYEDTEGSDYKLQVMAKMTGSKLEKKPMVRVTTVASLDIGDAPRASRSREKRANSGGAFR
jgi:DNA replication regulator DPB11